MESGRQIRRRDGVFTTTPFVTKIGYPYMICGTSAVAGQAGLRIPVRLSAKLLG